MNWEKYINGNESIFSDLFQGQSFSEICCTQCTKVIENEPSWSTMSWLTRNLHCNKYQNYLLNFVGFFGA